MRMSNVVVILKICAVTPSDSRLRPRTNGNVLGTGNERRD
jgi:hypothetical protein